MNKNAITTGIARIPVYTEPENADALYQIYNEIPIDLHDIQEVLFLTMPESIVSIKKLLSNGNEMKVTQIDTTGRMYLTFLTEEEVLLKLMLLSEPLTVKKINNQYKQNGKSILGNV